MTREQGESIVEAISVLQGQMAHVGIMMAELVAILKLIHDAQKTKEKL